MKTITIIISPEGKAKVETYGYTGSDCRNASQFIEDALGSKTVEQLTPAYFTETTNHNKELIQCNH